MDNAEETVDCTLQGVDGNVYKMTLKVHQADFKRTNVTFEELEIHLHALWEEFLDIDSRLYAPDRAFLLERVLSILKTLEDMPEPEDLEIPYGVSAWLADLREAMDGI